MKTKIVILFLCLIAFSCQKDKLTTKNVKLNGYAQKGPFIVGANVTIIELDNDLNPTGKTYYSTIDNNAGHFEFPEVTFKSNYIQLKIDGDFYDEVHGGIPMGGVTLNSFVDIQKDTVFNVNILTQFVFERIKTLIKTGKSFDDAKKQSQKELMTVFGFDSLNINNFNQLDLTTSNIGGGVLLFVSSVIMTNWGTSMTIQELTTNVTTDFADNGLIDSGVLQKSIATGASSLDISSIKHNLISKYSEMGKNINIYEFNTLRNKFLSKTSFPNALSGIFPPMVDNMINLMTLPDSSTIDLTKKYCVAINSTDNYSISNAAFFLTSATLSSILTSNINWYPDGTIERVMLNMNGANVVVPITFTGSGNVLIQINVTPVSRSLLGQDYSKYIVWK